MKIWNSFKFLAFPNPYILQCRIKYEWTSITKTKIRIKLYSIHLMQKVSSINMMILNRKQLSYCFALWHDLCRVHKRFKELILQSLRIISCSLDNVLIKNKVVAKIISFVKTEKMSFTQYRAFKTVFKAYN